MDMEIWETTDMKSVRSDLKFKIMRTDFAKLFKNMGYSFFENGLYNLNIIGIRSDNKNKVTNKYDDVLVLIYNNSNGKQKIMYPITTEPGLYYMTTELGNAKGTAILVPGQYKGCWAIGKHNGKYKALVQVKPVKVYRDKNKDKVYDMNPKTVDNGVFGINIHRSNENWTRDTVDMYSAGCQVFANPNYFKSFISICEKQAGLYGNSFTYTLINEKDLDFGQTV